MRTQVRGQSYQHPFAQQELAQPLNGKEKQAAIKSKDWDILIESHMRLGCSIAGRYVSLGGNSDEMVSAAMLGIVTAVDNIKQGLICHDNITGYIIHYIHQFCTEALRTDRVILVPQKNGTKIIVCPITDNNIEATVTKIGELYETLEHIAHTRIEKNVIFLRQQGHTDFEIADVLNISRSTVTKTRKRLLERYNNV